MEAFANVDCVLKVNQHCGACKMKMMEVLGSIVGVYDVSIDAREGIVKISGEVDPNMLLNAIAKAGKHAELVSTKLKHPHVAHAHASYGYISGNRNNFGQDPYYPNHCYGTGSYSDPQNGYNCSYYPDYYNRPCVYNNQSFSPIRHVPIYSPGVDNCYMFNNQNYRLGRHMRSYRP